MVKRIGFFLIVAWILTLKATLAGSASPEIIEGAKREGTLMLYTSMNTPDVNGVFAAFQKKYPFVTPKNYTTRSAALLQRILTEAQAGRHAADVIQGNIFTLYVLSKKGITAKYVSPEAAGIPVDFRDPNGHWTAVYQQLNVIGYNSKLVSPKEAPRSYEDLLHPKWKGKMALDDKQYVWFDGLLSVMGKEKGMEFMKRLATQEIHFRSGQTLLADLLAAGEFAVLINTRPDNMVDLKKKGAPTEWVAPNPTTVNLLPIGVAARAPHPNAARLFVDFVLSEEGQRVLGAQGKTPSRPKIPTTYPIPDVKLVVNDPAMSERLNEVAEVYKKVFNLP
ncbi:MAG TPA: extracellular solute-binding protein [Candidatus Acidoferrales bacterium]|nr:extracellular solute-binding protein [Candidatus Acidoferrales bacterium]